MKLRLLLIPCALLLLVSSVLGDVTGRITGVITDAENSQPLVGVTVQIDGTSWGAITDADGRYMILNIPVGTYIINISAVGYARVQVSNVMVHADLVTYVSQAMTSEAAELGTVIEVRAERPLVMKDKTTTVDIVSREELQALPTRGFEQVVGIQNGVVRTQGNADVRQRGGREALSTSPELNLRGGRPSEVAYYVDGFSQQDPVSGVSTANISNNAIKEVAVTAGAFSAEYGHVASGIVNVTTRSGTEDYQGAVEAVTDNFFPGEKQVYDRNFYSADFSGPVPGLDKAYFFFSGERRYFQDRQPSARTQETFLRYGMTNNDGNMLPNNSTESWSYQGKVDYNLTPNFKVVVNGNGSIENWQEYRHYYNNPRHLDQVKHSPRYRDENLGLNLKVTHTLNADAFYNLSVSTFRTERFRGDGIVFDDLAAYNRGFTNPEYDDFNLFREGQMVLVGSDSVWADSYFSSYLHRISSYIQTKGDMTYQWNPRTTTRFGFDFQRHTVRYYENLNPTNVAGVAYERVNHYGFDINGNETDGTTEYDAPRHPINLGIWAENRLEWRGLIINAGLRFDYFDYDALRIKDLANPFGPVNDGTLDAEDLEASKDFTRVSPRLGMSFPISDVTQMHINYGKFFQRPDLRRLYVNYDFFEARVDAGSFYPIGSPNLEPEKTTQYEVGLTHQLGDNNAVELTAFYKDVEDLTQIYHQAAVPKAYDYYANADYGTIKGMTFGFTMRRTNNIAMDLKYTLQYATGTGSYANSQYNVAWKNPGGTPKSTRPLDFDQRHSIVGIFDYRTGKGDGPIIAGVHPLENFGVNVLVVMSSGLPYTPTEPYDGVTVNAAVSQVPTGPINSARLPWYSSVDMKMEREVTVYGFKLTPYLWITNIFNAENVVSVYEGTGQADVSGYLETEEGRVRSESTSATTPGDEFVYRYGFGQNNPKNYGEPRMIFLGVRASF